MPFFAFTFISDWCCPKGPPWWLWRKLSSVIFVDFGYHIFFNSLKSSRPTNGSRSTSQASTLVRMVGEAEECMKCLMFQCGDLSLNLQLLMWKGRCGTRVQESQEQEDPWSSLAREACSLSELLGQWQILSQKLRWRRVEADAWGQALTVLVYIHLPTPVHTQMNI